MSNGKKSIAERSYEVGLLVERLAKLVEREQITYEELSKLLGENAQSERNRGRLASARRIVEREHGIVIVPIRNVGLMRGDNAAITATGHATIKHVRSVSRTRLKALGCVDVGKMNNEEKIQFNTVASHLGVLKEFSGTAAVKKIESAVQATADRLPVAKTVAAFLENGKK